ncbi:MAG TPA: sulfatase [Vicinamibacteria bacterium]|nr:sulfatase [Vicinamibacteria bacterium]
MNAASVISSTVPMRRVLSALIVAGLLAAAGLWIYRPSGAGPRSVVFDLADRLPFAARASEREVIMFGWPGAEPHAGRGMDGDPETRGRERFLWAREGATLSLEVREPKDRALIFDLEAYPGIEGQRLEVRANGRSLGEQDVASLRSRIRFDWPKDAQAASNTLDLRFPKSTVSGTGDTRDLAAAVFSLTIGDAMDGSLDLLRERDTPRGFEISEKDAVPSVVLPGASSTSFAFRLPEDATLEFESGLSAWSAASGGKGSLLVSFEATGGKTRDRVEIPLAAQALQPARIRLEGEPGTPVMVKLDVLAEKPGLTFAQIRAPRVLGRPAPPASAPAKAASKFALGLSGRKPNVVFIVLDAARAQSFGVYGHSRKTTPNLDRLAGEGFVFDNAYTTAAYTLAAMSSVWTSQQPDRHHGDLAFSAKLPKDRLMLAEVLTAQGVHTAGFVANSVAGAYNGFDRGFKEFDEPWKKYGSQASGFRNVVPPFLDRMKKEGAPFFAYVHYREPHHPYDPPPPFNTAFGPDAPVPKARREGGAVADKWLKDINQGVVRPSAEEIDHIRRLYDGNLAFADQEVGYLRGELESRGLLDNTVVIVIGDHGEGLFEHGYIGHNAQVFEETARVPLLVVLPKAMRAAHPPARVASLVDLTDIAPTVLDIFGLAGAGGSARAFQGHSLLSHLYDPRPAKGGDAREVLTRTVWSRPVYALRNTSHTFIYNTATADFSLFDRSGSPRLEDSEHDYAPRAPVALRETYRQNLLAWIASLKGHTVAADKLEGMSRQQCEELKALGYLSAKTACPAD